MRKVFSIATILLSISFNSFSQTYFDLQKDVNYKCGWDNSMPETSDLQNMKHIDYNYLLKVFDTIANYSNVEYNYPQGGCQHRAHIMSLLLNKYKIEHSKIWLFAPVDLYFDRKEVLTITDKNELSDKNTINWNYHVAPLVLTENKTKGKLDTLIFDPSLDKTRPLTIQEWFGKIGNSTISKYAILNPSQYFFYVKYNPDGVTFSTVISGCYYKYEGYTKDNFTIEKGLALNDMSILIYNKHIKPLQKKENQVDKLNGLKLVFGNASTADLIFATKGNITNQKVLAAIDSNKDIVDEARKIFDERMSFWKVEIQKLTTQ